jgi:pimeloyl-ACP methyl ester carboxylesterase
MPEYPVLAPTSIGYLGGVVSEPDFSPVASVVLLPGWGSSRSEVNRLFARLARGLMGIGAVGLRLDYPGWWDGDPVPELSGPGAIVRHAVQEATAWFRERAGDLDLLFVGACYGGQLAVELAEQEPGVRGVAFIAPFFRMAPSPITGGARRLLGPTLPLVRRVLGTRRYRGLRDRMVEVRDSDFRQSVAVAARRVPVWILVGEHDHATGQLDWLTSSLPANADVDIETVPGTVLHTFGAPAAQEETLARVLSWARGRMGGRFPS